VSSQSLRSFPCEQCGKCCSNVHLADSTKYLDRGDGVCRHLNKDMLCNVYSDRPSICRVDQQFEQNYSKHYSWDEFITINIEVCDLLRGT
jgi:Fe-S-cluster containining protein